MTEAEIIADMCLVRVREEIRWKICRKRERQNDRNFLSAIRCTADEATILANVKSWKNNSWNHEVSDEEVNRELKKLFGL